MEILAARHRRVIISPGMEIQIAGKTPTDIEALRSLDWDSVDFIYMPLRATVIMATLSKSMII